MSEQLLNILKLCLLGLVYLFFLRVLRAVWAEVSDKPRKARRRDRVAVARPAAAAAAAPPPAAVAPRKRKRSGRNPSELVVLEPPDQKGRRYALGQELTVGRAAGCQVTVDDTYVSQLHARVFTRESQLYVEDLGSTNGTYLNRAKVGGPMMMQMGDQLQVGNTVLEVS